MKRLRSLAIWGGMLCSALALLAWSQTWFLFHVSAGLTLTADVTVTGTLVAPSLIGGALLGFVSALALLISARWLRYLVAVLFAAAAFLELSGVLSALVNPVASSIVSLSKATGLADVTAVAQALASTETLFWPYLGMVAAIGTAALSVVIFVTASRWPATTSRYDREVRVSMAPDSIESWDRLSAGSDPTG